VVRPPVKRPNGRGGALPTPELISLLDDPSGPYRNSPDGWWDKYGGRLDPVSGVVQLPPHALCVDRPCRRCREEA
jgi:hypothetical protein